MYGKSNKFPVDEKSKLNPKNIYGLAKNYVEEYIDLLQTKKQNILVLDTVYGEWGRPDMLILKYLDYAKKNKSLY